MNVTCCNRCVEESVPASRRSNLDLPELAFNLPEFAAFRVKAIILDVLKDSQDDGAILGRKILDRSLKITSTGSRGRKSQFHDVGITKWL